MIEPALITFGPRLYLSPFFDATQRWGCKAYSIYNHTYMPLYYESFEADYWKLVTDVTLWDVACQRQVEITGPDAARFTQLLTPRDLSTCAVGQCKYVLVTAEDGGVLNDPVLLRLGENHFWLSLADSDVLLWAKGVARHAGLDVTIDEPDVSPLQVQGTKSTEVMRALFGGWIDDLRYYWFREVELDGIPLVVSRTGWSQERGYEVFLRDGSRGDELWERIMAAGKACVIAPGAPSTIRRIEAGILSCRSDITRADTPFHIGLDRLVDLDMEADFIGKEALGRIAAKGVERRLAGLAWTDPGPIDENQRLWPVRAGDAAIGEVRNAVFSPRLEKNIALAMLAVEHTAPGAQVIVDVPHGQATASVVETPFYDPNKTRVR